MKKCTQPACVCGHHPLAHHAAGRYEFGGPAGRYGPRGACADCRVCPRYSARRRVAGGRRD